MIKIPPQLQNPLFKFIKLGRKSKKPIEKDWVDTNNYNHEDIKNHDGNIGLLCGRGSLVVVDADTPELEQALEDFNTFTIETGSGGKHYYFQTDNLDKVVFKKNGKHYGELQGNGSQVLIPGCTHPNGKLYKVVKDVDIAYIQRSELRKRLGAFIPEEIEPVFYKNEYKGQVSITDVVPMAKLKQIKSGEYQGPSPFHSSKTGHNFNVNTDKNVAKCWAHDVGGDPLYWLAVNEKIINCGDPNPSGQDFKKVLNVVKQKGFIKLEQPLKEVQIPGDILSILKDPNLFSKITEDEFSKKIVGEVETCKTIFLNALGIYVDDYNVASFNLCIDSESGAGKDYVTNTIVEYFPKVVQDYDMGWVRRRRISPTVFNYWKTKEDNPNWSWNGKICYLPDISNQVANHEVFKVMCSEGSEATITVNNKAVEIEVEGKPVMFITTASTRPNKEMLRRFPRISLDESVEQTKAIMLRKAEFAAEGKTQNYNTDYRKSLKYLRRVKVKVPFSRQLVEHFPPDHIIMRTHFDRFIDYIKASAAFHQYQRKRIDGVVLADPLDYDIARIALIKSTSNKFMIPLTKREKTLIDIVKKQFHNKWVSVPELSPYIKYLSERKLYDYLDKLKEWFFDVDKQDRENSKKPVQVYLLRDTERIHIPTWEEVSCRKESIDSVKSDESSESSNSFVGTNESNELNEPLIYPPELDEKFQTGISSSSKLKAIKSKEGGSSA